MRDAFWGVAAVLVGHGLVLLAGYAADGSDPVIYFSAAAIVLLGVIQILYVVPLLIYGLWRRRRFAIGVGVTAVLTVAFTAVGLLHQ